MVQSFTVLRILSVVNLFFHYISSSSPGRLILLSWVVFNCYFMVTWLLLYIGCPSSLYLVSALLSIGFCSSLFSSLVVPNTCLVLNDSSIRLWALTGEVLMEMVGHTSIVYSVDAHVSGLIVSASEDCSAKIWKGYFLIFLGGYFSLLHCFDFVACMCGACHGLIRSYNC